MSIPSYEDIMLPLLKFLEQGEERSLREAVEALAEEFRLAPEERKELLPSGQQPVFANRVGWARTYLKKAGLVESTRRGYIRITDRGREALRASPHRVDNQYLVKFPEFREFRARRATTETDVLLREEQPATPEEQLARLQEHLRQDLASELLERVRQSSPSFFEQLVLRLLVAMGYGGTFEDAARAVGRSGDGGIDGVIYEDRLGLDVVYLQAKRWDRPVGRPEIQAFVGALHGHHARKGVLITSGSFTKEARDYAANIETKIVLIEGLRLAELMIEYDVGVSTTMIYKVKKVDLDFFSGE